MFRVFTPISSPENDKNELLCNDPLKKQTKKSLTILITNKFKTPQIKNVNRRRIWSN